MQRVKTILTLLLSFVEVVYSQTCASSTTSVYDGYLEPEIYSGSFSQFQNSQFLFSNPFESIQLNQGTVHFWTKITGYSENGARQSGTFFDCSETMRSEVVNDTITATIQSSKVSLSTTLTQQVDAQQLQDWNHIAFSFFNKRIYFYLNAVQQGQGILASQTFLNTSITMCSLGNSINKTNPINALFRHVQFTKTSLNRFSLQSRTQYIHTIQLPGDITALSYFSFGKNFDFQETYYYDPNHVYENTGVQLVQTSEPEFVCYCTGTYPNYLKLSNSTQLQNITLPTDSGVINTYGFHLVFVVYPYEKQQFDQDEVLFTLYDYANITLTNQSRTLQVDVLSSTGEIESYPFTDYKFTYNYWTNITIVLFRTQVQLFVNGTKIQILRHQTTLSPTPTTFKINSPSTFSMLLYQVMLSNFRKFPSYQQNFAYTDLTTEIKSTLSTDPSTMEFDSVTNTCIDQVSSNLWTGVNCQDQRLVAKFNSQTQQNTNSLQMDMQSSRSTQTIEMWIKDQGTIASREQVIFENEIDLQTNIQISISNGVNNQAKRNITCYIDSNNSLHFDISTYNSWVHFACVSDAIEAQSKVFVYASSDKAKIKHDATFSDQTSNIPTSIGSSIDGTNQFVGFIRQFRIWKSSRSETMVKNFRFLTMNGNTPNSEDLVYYFRFDDQINPLMIYDAKTPRNYFEDNLNENPIIDFQKDTDLLLCQKGYFYSQTCCLPLDISNANFIFKYSTGGNQFEVYFDTTSITNSYLRDLIQANFSVVDVGYNFPYEYQGVPMLYMDYLKILIDRDLTKSFSFDSILVDPLVSNITIQATFYTNIEPENLVIKNWTLTLTCPKVWLTILPNFPSDSQQLVSKTSTESDPIIKSIVKSTCYNAGTDKIVTHNVSSITWNYNISQSISRNAFQVSSDQTQVSTIRKNAFQGQNKYVRVYTSVRFPTTAQTTTMAYMNFIQAALVTTNLTSRTEKILQGNMLTVDMSNATSTNALYPIVYQVECPSIFASQADYDLLCQVESNGTFNLDTSLVQVLTSQTYVFKFFLVLEGTSIFEEFDVEVNFVKDGGYLPTCPTLIFEQETYKLDLKSEKGLTLVPNVYEYCNGTHYSLISLNWTAQDYNSASNLSSIFSYDSQEIYTYAHISQAEALSINAGSQIKIVASGEFQEDGQVDLISVFNDTIVELTMSNLTVNIKAQDYNGSELSNNEIDFIEPLLILDSSSSFDPDNTSQELQYTWTCPEEVLAFYTCEELVNGTFNQQLVLDTMKRAQIGFIFGQAYNFTVNARNIENEYKISVNKTIQIVFNSPTTVDSKRISNTLQDNCTSMEVPLVPNKTEYIGVNYQRVVRYDLYTANETEVEISYNNSDTCVNRSIQEQALYIYLFGQSEIQVPTIIQIFNQTSNFQIENILDYMAANPLSLTLNGSSDQLIAQLNESFIQIDKYSVLTLNASLSYDPDNQGLNYTYQWTCPVESAVCSSQSSSMFKIRASQRNTAQINTVNSTYNYSVVMTDGTRVSEPAQVQVQIIENSNYDNCLITELNTAILDGYSEELNNTLFIQYFQQDALQIQMTFDFNCNGLTLTSSIFYTLEDIIFWTTSQNRGQITLSTTLMTTEMTPGVTYGLYYEQPFYLGDDSEILLYSYSWFNIQLVAPQLVIQMSDPNIFTSLDILLDASYSYDPIGDTFSYEWTCPDALGGLDCQLYATDNGLLQLTQENIIEMLNTTELDDLYNVAHEFTLTITSIDQVRETSQRQFVYVARNNSLVDEVDCKIYALNQTGLLLDYNTYNMFEFQCYYSTLQNTYFQTNHLWSVNGMTQDIDYFTYDNQLYIKPYLIEDESQIEISLILFNITESPIKQAFKIKSPYLGAGRVLSQPLGLNTMYSQPYQLLITQIQTQNTGVLFQVRAYFNQYSCNQVFYPIMALTQDNLGTYYSEFLLPYISYLYVDYYDMNQLYLGSESVITPSSDLILGDIQFDTFEESLYPITSKNSSNYVTANGGMTDFEIDIQKLKSLSEALVLDIVYFNETSYLDLYKNEIVSYLITNYYTQISKFGSSSYLESRNIIQKKVIYILGNTLTSSINMTNSNISMTIRIMEEIEDDSDLWSVSGDEQQTLRELTLQILQTIYDIIPQATTGVQDSFYNRVLALQLIAFNEDINSLVRGQVTDTFSDYSARSYLLVQSTLPYSATFSSTINQNEQVTVQNQANMSSLGIDLMEVAYQPQSNATSVASSIVLINAYDSNNNQLNIAFDQYVNKTEVTFDNATNETTSFQNLVEEHYITFQLQIQESQMSKFTEMNDDNDDYQYKPYCVYYNTTTQQWETNGVKTVSYNHSMGILNCSAYHLTEFTIDYYDAYPDTGEVVVPDNSTDQDQDEDKVVVEKLYYFQENTTYYIIVLIVTIVLTVILIIVGFIQTTKWNEGDPGIESMERNHQFCSILGATFLLHAVMISCFVGPNKGSYMLTMPKYVHMINRLTIFFFITVVITAVLNYASGSFSDWQTNDLFLLGVITVLSVQVYRSIITTITNYIYFGLLPQKKTSYNQSNDRSGKYKYEGGEDEKDTTNQNQPNSARRNQDQSHAIKSTLSDYQFDDIEDESVPQNNTFDKSKQSQRMNKPNSHEKITVTKKMFNKDDESHGLSDEEGGRGNVNRISNLKPSENNKQIKNQIEQDNNANDNSIFQVYINRDLANDEGQGNNISIIDQREVESGRVMNETQMVLNKTADNQKEQPQSNSPQKTSPLKQKYNEEPVKYAAKIPTQTCSLIFGLFVLLVLMILAYAFMWYLEDGNDIVKHWYASILAIYFVFVFLLDPLFVILYSMTFSCMGPYSGLTYFMGVLLLGNGHSNLAHGILYDLNQK